MSSFNFFGFLAVLWLTIFDEQLCTSNTIPNTEERPQLTILGNTEATPSRENATDPHSLPRTSVECMPRDDYHDFFPLGSYKLHKRAVTWADARNICREEGAHLAIINSKAEATVLSAMMSQMGQVRGASHQDRIFLGIHDQFREGDWVTVLDDSIYVTGYTDWSDKWGGQPDNGGGQQNCGSLLKEDDMDDIGCNAELAFVCEKAYPNSWDRC